MTTTKLSGAKLHKQAMFDLYNAYMGIYDLIIDYLNDYSNDEAFKSQIKRQLDSVEAIIRKEYKKSIGL